MKHIHSTFLAAMCITVMMLDCSAATIDIGYAQYFSSYSSSSESFEYSSFSYFSSAAYSSLSGFEFSSSSASSESSSASSTDHYDSSSSIEFSYSSASSEVSSSSFSSSESSVAESSEANSVSSSSFASSEVSQNSSFSISLGSADSALPRADMTNANFEAVAISPTKFVYRLTFPTLREKQFIGKEVLSYSNQTSLVSAPDRRWLAIETEPMPASVTATITVVDISTDPPTEVGTFEKKVSLIPVPSMSIDVLTIDSQSIRIRVNNGGPLFEATIVEHNGNGAAVVVQSHLPRQGLQAPEYTFRNLLPNTLYELFVSSKIILNPGEEPINTEFAHRIPFTTNPSDSEL